MCKNLYNNEGGHTLTLIHLAILLPVIAAVFTGTLYRYHRRIHLRWLVLPVPRLIFSFLLTLIPRVMNVLVIHETMHFMPRIGMNFDGYIDGLRLLFALVISGIGPLVVLHSIGYLSEKENLRSFYVFLLLFM